MKGSLTYLILGGLVLTIILQGVLFASTGMQANRLQKELSEITIMLNKLQTTTDISLTLASNKKEAVLGTTKLQEITQNQDPNDLLTPENLSLTLDTPAANSVKLKPNQNNIDAYEATRTSSRITGQLVSGTDYSIITKQTGWYLIKLDTQTNAWVQAQFVNETI